MQGAAAGKSIVYTYSFFDTDEYPKSIEVVVEWNQSFTFLRHACNEITW